MGCHRLVALSQFPSHRCAADCCALAHPHPLISFPPALRPRNFSIPVLHFSSVPLRARYPICAILFTQLGEFVVLDSHSPQTVYELPVNATITTLAFRGATQPIPISFQSIHPLAKQKTRTRATSYLRSALAHYDTCALRYSISHLSPFSPKINSHVRITRPECWPICSNSDETVDNIVASILVTLGLRSNRDSEPCRRINIGVSVFRASLLEDDSPLDARHFSSDLCSFLPSLLNTQPWFEVCLFGTCWCSSATCSSQG